MGTLFVMSGCKWCDILINANNKLALNIHIVDVMTLPLHQRPRYVPVMLTGTDILVGKSVFDWLETFAKKQSSPGLKDDAVVGLGHFSGDLPSHAVDIASGAWIERAEHVLIGERRQRRAEAP